MNFSSEIKVAVETLTEWKSKAVQMLLKRYKSFQHGEKISQSFINFNINNCSLEYPRGFNFLFSIFYFIAFAVSIAFIKPSR